MTTLSQTDICNMALSRIGAQSISDIGDTQNTSSVACATNWQLAFLETARAHDWNCLKQAVVLAAVAQTPIVESTSTPSGTTAWAPSTAYLASAYVTYGGQLYQALIANTSTASFINDLTAGFWFQTDVLDVSAFDGNLGSNYASGWSYQYALPSDYVTMVCLNDDAENNYRADYEIMGRYLYTDEATATIKYVAALEDTTIYDSLFVAALSFMLAGKIATSLRQDSGSIADAMMAYYNKTLREARVKDANEGTSRRFSPVQNSKFIASRWGSTNS